MQPQLGEDVVETMLRFLWKKANRRRMLSLCPKKLLVLLEASLKLEIGSR